MLQTSENSPGVFRISGKVKQMSHFLHTPLPPASHCHCLSLECNTDPHDSRVPVFAPLVLSTWLFDCKLHFFPRPRWVPPLHACWLFLLHLILISSCHAVYGVHTEPHCGSGSCLHLWCLLLHWTHSQCLPSQHQAHGSSLAGCFLQCGF